MTSPDKVSHKVSDLPRRTTTILHKLHIDSQSFSAKPTGKDVAGITKRIAQQSQTITAEQLAAEITKGKTYIPAYLKGAKNNDSWESQSVFALDIDNKSGQSILTVDDALTRLEKHDIKCCFIHTTFSHSESRPCFRIVFQIAEPIATAADHKSIMTGLLAIFPDADPAPKALSQFFYGGHSLPYQSFSDVLDISKLPTPAKQAVNDTPKKSQPPKQLVKTVGLATKQVDYRSAPTVENFSRRLRDVKSEDKLSTILRMVELSEDGSKNPILFDAARAARTHTRQYLDSILLEHLLVKSAVIAGWTEHEAIDVIQRAIEYIDDSFRGLKGAPLLFAQLRNFYGDSLKYDTRSFGIVRAGEPIGSLPDLRTNYVDSTGRDTGVDTFCKTLTSLVRVDNSFDPVVAYLDSLPELTLDDARKFLNKQAEVMGFKSNSHEEMLINRWSVGAVERAYHPGCLMDWCLVLKGKGGSGKSSFFVERSPYPGAVSIVESIGELKSENYGYKALRSNWVTMLDELDSVFGDKRELGAIKPLITKNADKFRIPYGIEEETHYRAGVFGATVNGDEPLKDDGAELRRWCTISLSGGGKDDHITGPRRAAWYSKTKDMFWRSAIALFKSGYGSVLSPSEKTTEAERKEESTQRVSGSLELLDQIEDIERSLYGTPDSPVSDAPAFHLDVLTTKFLGSGVRSNAAVKDIRYALEKSGWTSDRFRYKKDRQRLYRPSWYDTSLIGRLGTLPDLGLEDYGF